MPETILITGASGLLGRALVSRFAAEGFLVLAQFHQRAGRPAANVRWLAGDFSSIQRTAAFLKTHQGALSQCHYVIHNYGPIAPKASADLTGADLLAAFQVQLQPALDITRFLLARAPLLSTLFIGFEECGRVRVYKKILAYALAKNALPLLSRSLAAVHPGVRFNVFSPPSLQGATVLPPAARTVAPARVAARIFQVMKQHRSGCHYRYAPQCAAKKTKRSRHG
jgi:NAD(P)-dependent dehydrogenase (short-subunit alcohol dehydrogenase family)